MAAGRATDLVEANVVGQAASPDGIEQTEGSKSIDITL